MKYRRLIITVGLLLLFFLIGLLLVPSLQQSEAANAESKREKAKTIELSKGNHPERNIVQILGVGILHYKSVERGFSSGEWMQQINHFLEPNDFQTEEDFAWRDENNGWNKIDVYYGEHGEILHMEIHKGLFDTYPMDEMAIASLQNDQGLAIVRFGYTDALMKSGYSHNNFIKDTYKYWDFGAISENKNHEIEITPVVVKIISTGHSMSAINDAAALGREIPMVLIKTGGFFGKHEHPIVTDTQMDGFSYDEAIRRTWSLEAYAPIEWDGEIIVPPIGGGVSLNEPLMEAWKKRQAETGQKGKK